MSLLKNFSFAMGGFSSDTLDGKSDGDPLQNLKYFKKELIELYENRKPIDTFSLPSLYHHLWHYITLIKLQRK